MGLFQLGDFALHCGAGSKWKIDCDALSNEDIECLAYIISRYIGPFGSVEGVPSGGLRLAKALEFYCTPGNVHLIVDDVLTTGRSIEDVRFSVRNMDRDCLGAVIFARGQVPNWVYPLFMVPKVLWI